MTYDVDLHCGGWTDSSGKPSRVREGLRVVGVVRWALDPGGYTKGCGNGGGGGPPGQDITGGI
jgi:hypothetical protein